MAIVMHQALVIMGRIFKNFKGKLYRDYHLKGRTPDWDDYPTVKDFWNDFVGYRDSEEAKKISEANKTNSQKNIYPHRIGSRGYVRKLG